MSERRKLDWRFTAFYAAAVGGFLAVELFGVFRKAPKRKGGDTFTENYYALIDALQRKHPMFAWALNVFVLGLFSWGALHLVTRTV